MKRLFTSAFCLFTLLAAQATTTPTTPIPPSNISNPDSVVSTSANPAERDTIILPAVNQPAPLTGAYNVYKLRLDSIKKDVPLDYNEYVQGYIEIYAHAREEMGQVLGRTKYYFPIYEKAFKDAGIPEELKYLSIVESKLDPYAISRVGATGPWQFMFTTAKLYGLNMDDYVDDRRDPVQASYAAAAYLKDAYEEFGDWLLAIASYNCGKSNVEHAIDKAGASDFWSIRPYLPAETRGYVPAYIAMTYLMNYYSKHNIVPQQCSMAMQTDTVVVNKYISLASIAQALNVNLNTLTVLNPAYKRMIVNGTPQAPRRLVIPQIEKTRYSALYDVLNNSNLQVQAPIAMHVANYETHTASRPEFHKVRHGESLGDIADTYGVTVQDLKVWNHLHSNKAVAGSKLRLKEGSSDEDSEPAKKHKDYITYKVKKGDTLTGIAAKFDGTSVEKIKSLNGLRKGALQPGMTIKISRG
jgi:membrane-bound lytic murein transglycosylase D